MLLNLALIVFVFNVRNQLKKASINSRLALLEITIINVAEDKDETS